MSKNIIVSGASSGIGYELALKFAQKGDRVIAISRRKDRLEQLKSQSVNIQILSIDLNSDDLKEKIRDLCIDMSTIDVLINNAGQLINKPFLDTSIEEFAQQYNSNVLSAVNLIQACSPFLIKGSHIVNISSMGGFQGSSKFVGLSAYSSAKGALSILTECLAEEFKTKGVSVNALALGAVQTEMLETAFPDYQAPVKPNEMADYIVEFALRASRVYNGQVLPVTLGDP